MVAVGGVVLSGVGASGGGFLGFARNDSGIACGSLRPMRPLFALQKGEGWFFDGIPAWGAG